MGLIMIRLDLYYLESILGPLIFSNFQVEQTRDKLTEVFAHTGIRIHIHMCIYILLCTHVYIHIYIC